MNQAMKNEWNLHKSYAHRIYMQLSIDNLNVISSSNHQRTPLNP